MNENMRTEVTKLENPATTDAPASSRDVAELASRVDRLAGAMDSVGQLAVQTAQAVGHLKALRDAGDQRQVAEKRESARQDFIASHDAAVLAAEKSLSEGPRRFLVSLSGEPTSVRVIGSTDAENAKKRFRDHFGIIGLMEMSKQLDARELTAAEAEEETLKLNLAPPVERAKHGRELLGMAPLGPKFAPLAATSAV